MLLKLPYSLISVSGPDSERFLQGQVSCDVEKLALYEWSFGTANTPKGRMYSLFVIARTPDGFMLRVHNSIVDRTVETLAKYKVFFKCELGIDQERSVFGSFDVELLNPDNTETSDASGNSGSSTRQIIDLDGQLGRLVDAHQNRIELWAESNDDADISEAQEDIEHWMQLDCAAGIPEIYDETVDTFILQQLNLQDLEAVSFQKGCYTGQEIIARMKFLGKLKKKMYQFSIDTPSDFIPVPGASLIDDGDRKVAELVRAHRTKDGLVGLIVCDIALAEAGAPLRFAENTDVFILPRVLHYNSV